MIGVAGTQPGGLFVSGGKEDAMPARMRVLMTLGILLAAAVTAAMTVPVGVDEIGQIVRGTLAEALGVPARW